MATSTITAGVPVLAMVALASSIWPISSSSFGRSWNWRTLSDPVARVTALSSIRATRSIGTKIRRLVGSSMTRPTARGGCRPMLSLVTTSRTRPIDSPSGPKTVKPASRATNTLVVAATRSG